MKKMLCTVLCLVVLLSVAGCSKYSKNGDVLNYRGDLRELVQEDPNLIDDLFYNYKQEHFKWIECDDYILMAAHGKSLGTVDLIGENDIFFDEGLIRQTVNDDYYIRFRDDHVVTIRSLDGGTNYYFCTYADAKQWLLFYY